MLNASVKSGSVTSSEKVVTATVPSLNLPKFNGDYLKWSSFWQRFEHAVHNRPYPKIEKLISLLGYLEGKALAEVEGFTVSEENYDTIVDTLVNRFGNKSLIIIELQTKFREIEATTLNPDSFRNTVNMVCNLCRQLQNLGVDVDNYSTKMDIIEKMPNREKDELKWMLISDSANTTIDNLMAKMKEMALKNELITKKSPFFEQKSANTLQHNTSESTTNSFQKPTDTAGKYNCSLCDDESHIAPKCAKYVSAEEKLKQLRSKNFCTKCALPNHDTSNCRKKMICQICDGNHAWFLCTARKSTAFVNVTKKQGMLLTKEITVINPNTKETTDTVVIFDSGSQQSYISNELIKQLKLEQIQEEQLHVTGFGAKKSSYKSSLVKLKVKTKDNSNNEIYANSTKEIAESVPIFIMDKYDSQNGSIIYKKPGILIGVDYFFDFITSFEKRNDDFIIVNSTVGKICCKKVLPYRTKTMTSISTKQQLKRTFKSSKTQQQITSEQQQYQMANKKTAETVVKFDPLCSTFFTNIHPQIIKDDTIVSETEQFYAKKNANNQLKLDRIQLDKVNSKTTPKFKSKSQKKIQHHHKFEKYPSFLTPVTDVTDKSNRQNDYENDKSIKHPTTTRGGEGLVELSKKYTKLRKDSMRPYFKSDHATKVIPSVTDGCTDKLNMAKNNLLITSTTCYKDKPPERFI